MNAKKRQEMPVLQGFFKIGINAVVGREAIFVFRAKSMILAGTRGFLSENKRRKRRKKKS